MTRLALLSNVTVDLLAAALKGGAEVYLPAGFDTWQQELLNPSSGFYRYHPEAVVVLLHADACVDAWACRDRGLQLIDGWCGAIETLAARLPDIPVLVSSLDISGTAVRHGAEERHEGFYEDAFVQRVEALHGRGARAYVLPVKDAVAESGRERFYSPKMWYMGGMPYSMKGLSALSRLILRYLSTTGGERRKCLALDLDGTLWGGVIGEDGVEGIQLSSHGEGAQYQDAQRLLKKMREKGVLLAILSKNNPEDVEPAFSHPDMVLRREDFVAEAIDWRPKSENIRSLAAELNIGLDAFVFLDDNPAERERMRVECPEVAVADFPEDTALLPRAVAEVYDRYFLSLEVTGEDRQKAAMYHAEARRRAARGASASFEDFLGALGMTMGIHPLAPSEGERVAQLVGKTNQFNVTTKRYTVEEIRRLAANAGSDVFTVRMADRYGEQGLVAVLIVRYKGGAAEIDTFLMSCRVMGRRAEVEIMAWLRRALEGKGIQSLSAQYVRTAKNAPVSDLFEGLGFELISEQDGVKRYEAPVARLPRPTGLFRMTEERQA